MVKPKTTATDIFFSKGIDTEDPLVANTNFDDVNRKFAMNLLVESQTSPLRRYARLKQNTNYEFSAEVEDILKYAELPRPTNEALKKGNWRDAMQREYYFLGVSSSSRKCGSNWEQMANS